MQLAECYVISAAASSLVARVALIFARSRLVELFWPRSTANSELHGRGVTAPGWRWKYAGRMGGNRGVFPWRRQRPVPFAGLGLLCSALILSGCGTPNVGGTPGLDGAPTSTNETDTATPTPTIEPEPSPEAPAGNDPVELINMWRVTAPGEDTDTWLRLDAGAYDLWRACGPIMGGWRASTNLFIASRPNSWVGTCEAPEDIPWLTAASSFEPTGDGGWRLLDVEGRETASLRFDGLPPAHPNVWDEGRQPPEVTAEIREAFREPAPLPDSLVPPTEGELLQRWIPIEEYTTEPFAEFLEEPPQSWQGSDGCNGVGGAWRLSEAGIFLATSGPQTAIGCEGVPMGSWIPSATRLGIDGEQLVLVDRDGAEIGRLRPAVSAD